MTVKKKISGSKFLPFLILLLLALIWGSSFILIKRGLDAFTPFQVGALRLALAFFALLPIAVTQVKKTFLPNWRKFMIFGIVGNLIPASFFPLAEQGLASSLTGILNSLTPIFTLLIGVLFFKVGMNRFQLLGLFVSLIGALILGFVNNSGGLGSFNFYATFVLLATICYGLSANMVKQFFHNINTIVLTSLQMFSIGFFALAYLLLSDFPQRMISNPVALTSLGYVFILGVVNTAFALVIFNKLIQITTAVFASTVTYLIPVTAIVWGIIDGEEIFPLHLLGMVLILGGVFLVNNTFQSKKSGADEN